jgi:N6-adenosine-specific RNA methylase IME4
VSDQRFRVIVSDPPWRFGDPLPGDGRGAGRHYETMSVWQICAMEAELPRLSRNAYLFLWRVSSMVEEAYQVVRAWGFTPKTEIVWQKVTKNGEPWFGMGRTLRASHEACIVATRGTPRPLDRGIRSRFAAKVPVDEQGRYIHSAKPDAFYGIVERLSAGPYYEMFSRRKRPGWTQVGNEAGTR